MKNWGWTLGGTRDGGIGDRVAAASDRAWPAWHYYLDPAEIGFVKEGWGYFYSLIF